MRSLFTVAVAAMISATFAQPAPREGRPAREIKPAWAWSESERLAARLDPAAAATRVNAALAHEAATAGTKRTESNAAHTRAPRPMDVIRGAEHPELFLPHAVFGQFMQAAFGAEDATAVAVREANDPRARAHGLPATFWATVRIEGADYIAALRAEARARQEAGQGMDMRSLTAAREASCRARVIALQRLRDIFGRETLDRFSMNQSHPT